MLLEPPIPELVLVTAAVMFVPVAGLLVFAAGLFQENEYKIGRIPAARPKRLVVKLVCKQLNLNTWRPI